MCVCVCGKGGGRQCPLIAVSTPHMRPQIKNMSVVCVCACVRAYVCVCVCACARVFSVRFTGSSTYPVVEFSPPTKPVAAISPDGPSEW